MYKWTVATAMTVNQGRGAQPWARVGAVEVVRTGLLAGEMDKPEGGAGCGAKVKFEKFLRYILMVCKPAVGAKVSGRAVHV